jgi:hypothetical protein
MNTLGSWAIDRSYGAGRAFCYDRHVRMVVAPVLPHDTRRIRHIGLPQLLACPDRSLSRILPRNKPNSNFEGGDRPKLTLFTQ